LVENFGAGRIREKKTDASREMFIRETGSMGSSSTGALVAAGSLQPLFSAYKIVVPIVSCII
jgi:hypothetical protein